MQGLSQLTELNDSSARDAVLQILRQAILDGRAAPGERLVERDLADLLGVSRTPVREALQKLEQEHLVRKMPRRGMVVAGFSPREVNEVYLIRSTLEGLATGLAAERCSPEKLALLEELLSEMQSCSTGAEFHRYSRLHTRFNDLIYEAAASPRLHSLLLQLREAVGRFAEFSYQVPGRLQSVQAEHAAIVAAIRTRSNEAACAAAKYHVKRSRETLLAAMPHLANTDTSISRTEAQEEEP